MESKAASMEMLDEVTADMRLEWPGKRPYRSHAGYAGEPLKERPYYSRG
jgi:hypothetical protein